MASPDTTKSLMVTGQLAYGCTDLATAWPHGGTGLGLVGSLFFEPPEGVVRLVAEEDNATHALLYVGGDAVLGASLEGWDDSVAGGVLGPLFPSRLEHASGRYVLEWPGSTGTGRTQLLPGSTVPLLSPLVFTATNPEHPSLILYKAAPLIEASTRLRLSSVRTLSVPLLFVGTPDGTGRVAALGRLTDLSL